MREIIYYSKSAKTTGNFGTDFMKAGRMDIAFQIVISSFFVSNDIRNNVRLHLIFDGPPDPPKHIELNPTVKLDQDGDHSISKKDVAGLIKKMLYKYRKGEKREVEPGYFIEKKALSEVIEELLNDGKKVYLLDKKGIDIRKENFSENPVVVLGDHEGIPKPELKKLKKLGLNKVSCGPITYFASQSLTIMHNELDRREIF